MEPIDGTDIEALLMVAGGSARQLMEAATGAIVSRLGERGFCVVVGHQASVMASAQYGSLVDFALDLTRYPDVSAAMAKQEVVVRGEAQIFSACSPTQSASLGDVPVTAVVPLVTRGRALGAIIVQSTHQQLLDAADVATARLTGRLLATLLELRFPDLLDELGCAQARRAAASGCVVSLPAAPSSTGIPERSTRRLLIVDDDVEDAEWLAELLGHEGFVVVCAADGQAALTEARRKPPDLILLDINMPVMDGFATAKELANDPLTAAVPILFLSGTDDLMARVRSFDGDGVDFLRKPCSFLELLARIEKSLKQAESKRHLRLDANIDELTGLGNLRSLRAHLATEQSRIGRTGASLAIVMIDVDKLKEINDRHGHLVGNKVLKAIGETLTAEIRATDLAVRYGGDEFVVLLPHTTQEEAAAFGRRFLSRVNLLRPEGIDLSLSLGVAALVRSDRLSIDAVLGRADAAAYRAKRLGGNRVLTHDSATEAPPASDAVGEARP